MANRPNFRFIIRRPALLYGTLWHNCRLQEAPHSNKTGTFLIFTHYFSTLVRCWCPRHDVPSHRIWRTDLPHRIEGRFPSFVSSCSSRCQGKLRTWCSAIEKRFAKVMLKERSQRDISKTRYALPGKNLTIENLASIYSSPRNDKNSLSTNVQVLGHFAIFGGCLCSIRS